MAIDPSSLIEVCSDPTKTLVLKIETIPDYEQEEYDIYDDKDFKKYIDAMEKEVRGSFEYRRLIKYLREYMDMNKCSFYNNVSNIDTFKIKIEIHHHPFTLYDICTIVFNKRMFYHESLELQMVAKEVAILHYNMMVGLIPLSETVHELVHSKYLFIPVNKVMGRFNLFRDYYEEFMTNEQKDVIERIEEYSKVYNEQANLTPLHENKVFLDTTGSYDLPKFESLSIEMKDRIGSIKDNGYRLPTLLDDNQKPPKKNYDNNKVSPIRFFDSEVEKHSAVSFY